MATIAVGKVKPHRRTRIAYFREAASQSFDAGDVVMIATGVTGKISIAESDPIAAGGDLLVGVAAEDASGVEDTMIGVYLATEDAEFSANIENAAALALANIGTQYDLVLASGYFRVDTSDTTNPVVVVTELLDAVGDVNGRVVFKFINVGRTPHRS